MPNLTVDSVRQAFVAVVGSGKAEQIRESILIRESTYCGRHFKLAGYSLVWFMEENQVKLYTPAKDVAYSGPVSTFVMGDQQTRRAA